MVNDFSSDSNSTYHILYQAWQEELLSKTLTSLNLNFIKHFSQEIADLTSQSYEQDFINDIFIKRITFLIHNLINLRKIKILNSVLNKEQISTSYLSKQELLYYDYVKNSELILQNKPLVFSGQVKEFFNHHSNFKDAINDTNQTQPVSESVKPINSVSSSVDGIEVRFLVDLDEFTYLNNRTFGPFKKDEIAKVPTEVFSKVLYPKKIAQRNE